jgi:glycosyltransferase involved in cell wall biosynthesis
MQLSQDKLSVIHLVSSLNIGGAERFVLDLSHLQQSETKSIAIMSFGQEKESLQTVCNTLGIKVYNIVGSRFGKLLQISKVLQRFDIVHCHSPYPLKLMSILLPFLKVKKIIYTRHGANPLESKSWKWVHRFLAKFVDDITFVSKEGADVFQHYHDWPRHKKHVIDNGVNLSAISIKREFSKRLRLGSVGRMVELKNQKNLLQSIALLSDLEQQNIEVNFYGDGPCLESLKAVARGLKLSANVIFHGMVNDRDRIYSSLDVLVVTSETEGLSLAIIEAMAYQCAIIATDVGGNPKLVESNTNGWLFNYNDEKQLVSYIRQLLQNQTLAIQLGLQGRLKIENQFSLQNSAKKYRRLYEATGQID